MPQILNKYSFGSDLGAALGSGLGSGLQYLAQNKINQMTRANEMNQYSNLLQQSGLDPRDANVLAYHAVSNPEQFHHILEQYSPRQAINQQATEVPQYQQGLQQLEQQPAQAAYRQPTPEQAMQLQNLFKGLGQPQQEPSGLGEGVDLLRKSAASELLKTAVGKQPEEQLPQIRQPQPQVVPQVVPPIQQPQQPVEFTPQQIEEQIHPLLAKRKALEEKAARERDKEEKANQTAINKAEKPYVDKITAYKEAADDADKRLNKMENLVKKGSLPYSGYYNTLKSLEEHVTPLTGAGAGAAIGGALGLAGGPLAPASATIGSAIGGGIGAAVTPIVQVLKSFQRGITATDTEEFEKLSNDFIRNAKTIFGSRITDADLRAFMATLPTLSQTDEGKLAVIKNMKSFNKAAQVRYKAMRDVIKDNGNKIPADIQGLVEERAKPELDRIASDFEAV
jgi:hypothetical protein